MQLLLSGGFGNGHFAGLHIAGVAAAALGGGTYLQLAACIVRHLQAACAGGHEPSIQIPAVIHLGSVQAGQSRYRAAGGSKAGDGQGAAQGRIHRAGGYGCRVGRISCSAVAAGTHCHTVQGTTNIAALYQIGLACANSRAIAAVPYIAGCCRRRISRCIQGLPHHRAVGIQVHAQEGRAAVGNGIGQGAGSRAGVQSRTGYGDTDAFAGIIRGYHVAGAGAYQGTIAVGPAIGHGSCRRRYHSHQGITHLGRSIVQCNLGNRVHHLRSGQELGHHVAGTAADADIIPGAAVGQHGHFRANAVHAQHSIACACACTKPYA